MTLHKWKERPTLDTKISQFVYIKQPAGLCSEIRGGSSPPFFFFDYFLQFQLSDALRRALHQLLLFRFHITKLRFYSHIFKFKFWFLRRRPERKPLPRVGSSPPARQLRLQNSFRFYGDALTFTARGFKRLLISLAQKITLKRAQTELAPELREVGRRRTPSLPACELS